MRHNKDAIYSKGYNNGVSSKHSPILRMYSAGTHQGSFSFSIECYSPAQLILTAENDQMRFLLSKMEENCAGGLQPKRTNMTSIANV